MQIMFDICEAYLYEQDTLSLNLYKYFINNIYEILCKCIPGITSAKVNV